MSDYTPTTEEVRRDYVACNSSPQASMSDDDLVPIYVSRKWFDRWLAAHDREVAEKAWDEGFMRANRLVNYRIRRISKLARCTWSRKESNNGISSV